MRSFYIGKCPKCRAISAAMIDDGKRKPKEVADFAKDMHKSKRELEHITVEDTFELKLEDCNC